MKTKELGEYLLFAGHCYYPKGGMDDLVATGTIEELKEYFLVNARDIAAGSYVHNWAEIVETKTLRVVLKGMVSALPNDIHSVGVPEWREFHDEN